MRAPEYQSQQFRLWVMSEKHRRGVPVLRLRIRDRFYGLRHRPERLVFTLFVRRLERYLRHRQQLQFDHPKNRARQVVYLTPGIRAWTHYMPGGFATYPVHNPDLKRLHDGRRIGYLMRNLFRHSKDGTGLRSRAYAMSWYAVEQLQVTRRRVRWLSVAAGTGQPTYDAAAHLAQTPAMTLTDIDDEALAFARELAQRRGLEKHVRTEHVDITKPGEFARLLHDVKPDVTDMMGLMEYLDDKTVTRLVRIFREEAPRGSLLIFTNVRPTHPELETHRRGLGWPGVIVRRIDDVTARITMAGVKAENVTVLLPDDNVYALYCIKNP